MRTGDATAAWPGCWYVTETRVSSKSDRAGAGVGLIRVGQGRHNLMDSPREAAISERWTHVRVRLGVG
jgi:hypothetical protein